MKRAKGTALVVLAAMMFVPMTTASASDIHDEEIPTMNGGIDVAVYFGDNLAFTPQWRLDNYIRIEIMILNATGKDAPEDILIEETDIEGYTQEYLRANPDLLNNTNMISVSEIWVNITSEDGEHIAGWYSNFEGDGAGNTVIREINGEGHLIYGGKWDTGVIAETGATPTAGNYTVSVGLPGTYNVKWAVQHDRGVDEEPLEDVVLLSEDPVEDPAEAIGYMNVTKGGVDPVTNEAHILLGELLDGSGGGSNSGGDGDGGGNGPQYAGGANRRR